MAQNLNQQGKHSDIPNHDHEDKCVREMMIAVPINQTQPMDHLIDN